MESINTFIHILFKRSSIPIYRKLPQNSLRRIQLLDFFLIRSSSSKIDLSCAGSLTFQNCAGFKVKDILL